MYYAWMKLNMHTTFLFENQEATNHLGDLDVDGRVISG
jgi:hypothetical protein